MLVTRPGCPWLAAALVLFLSVACALSVSAGEAGGDWVPLFNGKNLDGWKLVNGTARYEIEGNAIAGTTAEGSPNSFLCTEKHYGDFELQFDVLLDPRLNSGVQIRSNSLPEYQNGRVHGYQVEIAVGGDAGLIYDEARRGRWLSTDRVDPSAPKAFKADGWNKYRVVCLGDDIKTWVNGVPVTHVVDSMTKAGFIGLQVHSFDGSPPAKVLWRNIYLKDLGKDAAKKEEAPRRDPEVQKFIDELEKACYERPVYIIGRQRGERLAELVRRAKPKLVVECGTAVGYSGLWIARELKAQGSGKLVTVEIDAARSKEAEANFRKAGLADLVTFKVGDARKVVKEIEGPIDFVFIDCDFQNYEPCFLGLEEKLRDGATVVSDNVLIGADGMAGFLERVRSKHSSRSEWFEKDLPWCAIDAMEVTVIQKR
jgi:predicted O-methyltransferase YrrM